MASYTRRGSKYIVRWRDPDGVQRTRTVPDLSTARRLAREVERTVALGHRWEPADAHAVPALIEYARGPDGELQVTGGVFGEFLSYARGVYAPGTHRHYDRALRRYLAHLAHLHPRARRWTLDMLTRDSLETWYGALREDVSVATARLYVGAVICAWRWAHESDRYGEVCPRPRRIKMPAPTGVTPRAPTWEQMDRVIAACHVLAEEQLEAAPPRTWGAIRQQWEWRARLLTMLRFTGLRCDSQVMRLRWEDVDLEGRAIEIRGELGKSRRERGGRIIPISPHLVELMAGWGAREGWLIAPHKRSRHAASPPTAQAWERAGVPRRIWAPPADRRKGHTHHAFRKGLKTGLSRLGVDREVRDYLVGHHRGIDDHYLDSLDEAREAVALIPALTDAVDEVRQVLRLGSL